MGENRFDSTSHASGTARSAGAGCLPVKGKTTTKTR